MVARPRACPPPPADLPALLALCGADGDAPDAATRRLLLALRQARVIEIRAIEDYLGLGPARSERQRRAAGEAEIRGRR
jgi:hypothetical protein